MPDASSKTIKRMYCWSVKQGWLKELLFTQIKHITQEHQYTKDIPWYQTTVP